nr:PREDICTED: NACHT, LRR and PYD domains-containing protein 3-like [Pundamilia nyererei]
MTRGSESSGEDCVDLSSLPPQDIYCTCLIRKVLCITVKELDRIRTEFVERVSVEILKQLLDALVSDGVFTDLEKESILEENKARANKARDLTSKVKKKGDEASRKMIRYLQIMDPMLSSELHLSLSFDPPAKQVVTMGVAGIGKTVLTQKFILDWAEDKTNQDIQFIFPFTFRELNVLKEEEFSLYQPPLDFHNIETLTDVKESTSVDVLLINLIRGNLLPPARLWITTRPAAANQIPPDCVGRVTEVRGFTDPQKEEYFRKRFRDEEQASRIISYIKPSRMEEIQQSLRTGRLSTVKMSPVQWSALVFVLLSSEKDLDVFDLKKYSHSEEAFLMLLPVVKASRKVL